jgi:hypothetical protein
LANQTDIVEGPDWTIVPTGENYCAVRKNCFFALIKEAKVCPYPSWKKLSGVCSSELMNCQFLKILRSMPKLALQKFTFKR